MVKSIIKYINRKTIGFTVRGILKEVSLLLPSSRYQLSVTNLLDETIIYPGKIVIQDYNNDIQTFTIDSNITSLDRYI